METIHKYIDEHQELYIQRLADAVAIEVNNLAQIILITLCSQSQPSMSAVPSVTNKWMWPRRVWRN